MKGTMIAVLSAVLAAAPAVAQHEGHAEHGTESSHDMESMRRSGGLDRDFVKSMLKHHRDGVEMARVQVERGKDEKAKEFAQKMIDNQTREIEQLESWLKAHPEKEGRRR